MQFIYQKTNIGENQLLAKKIGKLANRYTITAGIVY